MDFLWTILAVLFVTLIVVLIVYGERSVTSHWVFWLGIGLLILTFVGVPTAIVKGVNSLGL